MPQFYDDKQDTLTNPTVIIEVLSLSTEQYDRGGKFQDYQQLDSLQEYLLISQERMRVEQYVRQSSNQWLLTNITNADDTITLPSIDCTLKMADIYERVEFEIDDAGDAENKDVKTSQQD